MQLLYCISNGSSFNLTVLLSKIQKQGPYKFKMVMNRMGNIHYSQKVRDI